MKRRVLPLISAISLATTAGAQQALPVVVLRHANVADGARGAIATNAAVVIRDGRIAQIESEPFNPPSGATVIDVRSIAPVSTVAALTSDGQQRENQLATGAVGPRLWSMQYTLDDNSNRERTTETLGRWWRGPIRELSHHGWEGRTMATRRL